VFMIDVTLSVILVPVHLATFQLASFVIVDKKRIWFLVR
jgi:hypothetical protein